MGRKRKLENRDRILDGAAGLLREGRYRDLTVDALARRIQMSKSTLYKYYRDKDHLVDAVVVQSSTPLVTVLDGLDAIAPLDALRDTIRAWQGFGERCPAPILLERDRLPPAATARVAGLFDRVGECLSDCVDRAHTNDALRADPALVRVVLISTAHSVVLEMARGQTVDALGLIDLLTVQR